MSAIIGADRRRTGETMLATMKDHMGDWVVKAENDAAPHRMTEQDYARLADLVTEQAGRSGDEAREALEAALSGWLVQRRKGERPSGFQDSDYTVLLSCVPRSGVLCPSEAESTDVVAVSGEAPPPVQETTPPEIEREARKEAPLAPIPSHLEMAGFHLAYGI